MARGDPRLPPADLAARELPVITCAGIYWRFTHEKAPAVEWDSRATSRFSHPDHPCPVLYLGDHRFVGFWERFGDDLLDMRPSHRAIARMLIEERVWKRFKVTESLRMLDVRSPEALRAISADDGTFRSSYAITQPWGRALMEHPAELDGLIYQSRLDPPHHCLAIFGREKFTRLKRPFSPAVPKQSPIADNEFLIHLLTWHVGLV
jgi:hypothetical protein